MHVAAKLDTFGRYCHAMPFSSLWHYARWRRRDQEREASGAIQVTLRNGTRLELRPKSSDPLVASELFIRGQYDPPSSVRLENVRQIIDVGANVGYACLLFLARFPGARVTAFEPLPKHVGQIRKHLSINEYEDRVALIPAAASTTDGDLNFRDDEAGSHLETGDAAAGGTIRVPGVDWFTHLPEGTIDLLKMDIEGGEFALLSDPRFDAVARRTRVMVLEWHDTADCPQAKQWCARRLKETGLRVFDGNVDYGHAGIVWASRV